MTKRNALKVRTISDTNDTSEPEWSDAGVVDCADYDKAIVDVKVGGTSPQWDIQPLFGESYKDESNTWFRGTKKEAVAENTRYILDVNNAKYLTFFCNNKQGTTPTLDIWVILYKTRNQ